MYIYTCIVVVALHGLHGRCNYYYNYVGSIMIPEIAKQQVYMGVCA